MVYTKDYIIDSIKQNLKMLFRRTVDDASPLQVYEALAFTIREDITTRI